MSEDQVLCQWCQKPLSAKERGPDSVLEIWDIPACDDCWDGEEEQRNTLPEEDWRQDR